MVTKVGSPSTVIQNTVQYQYGAIDGTKVTRFTQYSIASLYAYMYVHIMKVRKHVRLHASIEQTEQEHIRPYAHALK